MKEIVERSPVVTILSKTYLVLDNLITDIFTYGFTQMINIYSSTSNFKMYGTTKNILS